ncbi:MAG: SufE family protein [Verrucomicrobia bacterium]|nr:SufE family protein [Verrucomicrobiota bacterium]
MMTIEELVENFELFDDWEDRYAYLMDLGKQMPPMEDVDKTEENRVKGCQATVWLKANLEKSNPPRITFVADSNSQIVKGLVSMLRMMYSGKTPREILNIDEQSAFKQLGLDRHLSPTRSTGLIAMVAQIKSLAGSEA